MAVNYSLLKRNFVDSSIESLEDAEKNVLLIEKEYNPDLINKIFRSIHTIKGSSGIFDLNELFDLTHVFESYLSKYRKSKLKPNKNNIDLILQGIDYLKIMIENLEETAERNDQKTAATANYKLIQEFKHELNKSSTKLNGSAELKRTRSKTNGKLFGHNPFKIKISKTAIQEAGRLNKNIYWLSFDLFSQGFQFLGELQKNIMLMAKSHDIIEQGPLETQTPENNKPDFLPYYLLIRSNKGREELTSDFSKLKLWKVKTVYESNTTNDLNQKDKKNSEPAHQNSIKSASVKIDTTLLDQMVSLTEEIVLMRNVLLTKMDKNNIELQITANRLASLVSSLQENILRTRLQPIAFLFQKLFRIVRDASQLAQKQVRLASNARDVELDKNTLEAIEGPILHIIRNAIDHGIESPEERVKLKKPKEGLIAINADMGGGEILISIKDDGAGLDSEKIKTKALELGLVSKEKIELMSKDAINEFIFHPGLSTAKEVNALSGRGVGMDVVLSDIKKINGSIRVESAKSEGTEFKILLPQTISITACIVLKHAQNYFAVLGQYTEEIMKVDPRRLGHVNGQLVYKLRNSHLPLISLNIICNLPKETPETIKNLAKDLFILYVRNENHHFGILTEHVINQEEVVIKKLDKRFNSILEYAGASILGTGDICLILDVPAINKKYLSEESRKLYFQEIKQKLQRRPERRQKTYNITLLLKSKIKEWGFVYRN